MSAISPNRKWSHSRSALIRVLVIDDSVVMRSTIARMFEGGCGVDVAGMFATTKDAFDFLSREQVDVVLLDHEMPGQKGLDALPAIIEAAKGAHVIMLSSHCKRGEKTTVKALSLGAADAIAKPTSRDLTPQFSQTLIKRVRDLAASSKQRLHPPTNCRCERRHAALRLNASQSEPRLAAYIHCPICWVRTPTSRACRYS